MDIADPSLSPTASPRRLLQSGGVSPRDYLGKVLEQRDGPLWAKRGRVLIFVLAVASLLGALITFTAHNWTYLSTVGKLGLIGGLLLISAVLWMWTRFDGPAGTAFGIGAQVLIGVWLAAAGQLYQAPGGLQDLLLTWSVLGLPFALASRHPAHWAVWLLVPIGAMLSPNAGLLMGRFGDISFELKAFIAALAMISAYVICNLRKIWTEPSRQWFSTLCAFLAIVLFVIVGVISVFDGRLDDIGYWFLSAFILAGALVFAYHRRVSLISASLFAAGLIGLIGVMAIRVIEEVGGDEVVLLALATVTIGGLTFILVQIFRHLLQVFRAQDETSPTLMANSDIGDEGRPWYMDAFIAFGGIITAILGAAFFGTFLGLFLAMTDSVSIGLILIGAIIYGLAIWKGRGQSGLFLRYLLNTFVLIGGGMLIGGIVLLSESTTIIPLSLLALGGLTLWLSEAREIEVIAALSISTGLIWLSYEHVRPWMEWVSLIGFGGLGVLATSVPIGRRILLAAGTIFFITAIFGSALDFNFRSMTDDTPIIWSLALKSFAIRFAILLAMFSIMKLSLFKNAMPDWVVLVILAAVASILPASGAAAALMLMTGYALGSKTLSLIGALATAWFLFNAYFDLNFTLMEISGMMAASGLGLLILWWFLNHRKEVLNLGGVT